MPDFANFQFGGSTFDGDLSGELILEPGSNRDVIVFNASAAIVDVTLIIPNTFGSYFEDPYMFPHNTDDNHQFVREFERADANKTIHIRGLQPYGTAWFTYHGDSAAGRIDRDFSYATIERYPAQALHGGRVYVMTQ